MKFGFKKKNAAASGEAKSSKRKSRSSGNGMASMKSFVANHGEKVVFGAIVIVAAYLIYSGFSQPGLDSEPEDVRDLATRATAVMDAETWPDVKSTRHPEPDTFKQQATEDKIDISADDFLMAMPWHPVLQAPRERRKDPDLIAPQELEVRGGYGPLAVVERAGRGDISDLMRGGASEDKRPLPDKYRERQAGLGGNHIESRFFVCITGLVPFQQQLESYQTALASAVEYDVERDTPNYLAIDLERREIQADGQPGQWVDLDARRVMQLEPRQWDGKNDERASSDHVLDAIVMPLPPLLFRDVSEWALHSKIPEAVEDELGNMRREVAPDAVEEDKTFDLWGRGGDDQRTDEHENDQVDDRGDFATAQTQLKVETGLLRFFDFQVEPGKTYEYRARLVLEDPNNPRNYQRPSENACEPGVIVRRQAEPDKRYRESDWSDVSPQVQVPTGQSVYAGPVVAPSLIEVRNRISLPRRATEEPEGTVMAVTWNAEEAMDVPAAVPVKRGSLINQRDFEAWAIDAAQSSLRRLPNYTFATNALIVDIAGGEVLERRGREELRAPGMMLIMDEQGNIRFHSEIVDFDEFEYYAIPPDEDVETFAPADRNADGPTDEDRSRGRIRGRRDRQQDEAAGTSELRGRPRGPR